MDQEAEQAPTLHHDPTAAPNRVFWLGALHVAKYTEITGLLDRPEELTDAFAEHWTGSLNEAAARTVFERFGDSREVQANLVLLAVFIEKKLQDAITDVARDLLPQDTLERHEAFKGRCHRRAAGALIYLEDPSRLLDVYLLDVWHPRPSCALTLGRHKRSLPGGAGIHDLPWEKLAADARENVRHTGTMCFVRAVRRPRHGDVVVAYRDRGAHQTYRHDDDEVDAGHRDDWNFLRFHDDLHRADVTNGMVERAKDLASAIASAVWSQSRRYKPARDPLDREALDRFLREVIDPAKDTFQLHEIIGEVPGHWRHPVLRVGNSGRERVEIIVQELNAKYGYAGSSKTVHKVKVGFDAGKRHYRVELHFPMPSEDENELILSYGNRGWSKNVADEFEGLMAKRLGVELHPKEPKKGRAAHRTAYPPKPTRLTPDHWRVLLDAKVDDPAPWQQAELEELVKKGIARLDYQAVFRCGDPHIPMHRRPQYDSFECQGEVVMPFGSVPGEDPLRPEPGQRYPCSGEVVHYWDADDFQFPAFLRIVPEIVAEQAWLWVAKLARSRGTPFEAAAPGVLACWGNDAKPRYLVFPRHAAAEWHDPQRARYSPTCWIGLDDDEVATFQPHAVTLPDLLGDGAEAIQRVLDLDSLPVDPALAAEGGGTPVVLMPAAPATEIPLEDLSAKLIQARTDGIVLGQKVFVLPQDQRVWLLFAIIQDYDRKDGISEGQGREYHLAEDIAEVGNEGLAELAGTGTRDLEFSIEAKDIHQWVRRARKGMDKVFGKGTGKKIIERGGHLGIRLAAGVECRGFSMQDELARYQKWCEARRGSDTE